MEKEREDEGISVVNIGSFMSLLVEYLRIVVEKERKNAEEDEFLEMEESQHEDQYPGSELEVWFYRDDFTFEWM